MALALLASCAAGGGGLSPVVRSHDYFYFDGTAFVVGKKAGIPVVLIKDGYYPVVQARQEQAVLRRLPEGAGGLIGVCFLQVSGGKLVPMKGGLPVAGRDVSMRGKNGEYVARTDENGYFVTALPEGVYDVDCGGGKVVVTIAKGKSSAVTVRSGKRMVD